MNFLGKLGLWCLALQNLSLVGAIEVDVNDPDSLKKAAKTAAEGMLTWYHGDQPGYIPGDFEQEDVYWWLAGAMFMSLIEYWSLTGDDSYNHLVTQGMLFQVGDGLDYEPSNQTTSEANDDQEFWGFAAMTAAELTFPDPPDDQPQWLELAQAVFNRISERWDATTCGGGFRWQFYSFDWTDHNYKNTISNGGFFQLAARLAHYTNNDTYAVWAGRTFDWLLSTPILVGDPESDYIHVWDGAEVPDCSADTLHNATFSYNYGTLITGSAYLYSYYNMTNKPEEMHKWMTRMSALIHGSTILFPNHPEDANIAVTNWGGDTVVEIQCELSDEMCGTDATSFKGYYLRWLTSVLFLIQDVHDPNPEDAAKKDRLTSWINERLIAAAEGAAKQCSGGEDGTTCGQRWWQDEYDGTTGVGQQMSAMSAFGNNLIRFVGPLAKNGNGANDNGFGDPVAPLTNQTGGTSEGNPAAGTQDGPILVPLEPITAGDKAGAAFLTIAVAGIIGSLAWFVVFSKDDMVSPHGLH